MDKLTIIDQSIEKLSLQNGGLNNELHRHVHMVNERMIRNAKMRGISRALNQLTTALGIDPVEFDIKDVNRISVSVTP